MAKVMSKKPTENKDLPLLQSSKCHTSSLWREPFLESCDERLSHFDLRRSTRQKRRAGTRVQAQEQDVQEKSEGIGEGNCKSGGNREQRIRRGFEERPAITVFFLSSSLSLKVQPTSQRGK